MPRLPSSDSISADSSPQMYAPAPTTISMSKLESGATEYVVAQQAQFAPLCQHCLQLRQQIAVLAAQIQETLFSADHEGAYRHSFEHRIGMAVQQDAILERAGLAFVGIADHIARVALRLAAEFPFHAGTESCAAPSAQPGLGDLGQRGIGAARQRCAQAIASGEIIAEQQAADADIVVYAKPFGRPVRERGFRFNQIGDAR